MSPRPRLATALALAALAALPARAEAHAVGLSRGDYTLDGRTLTAELTFARPELIALVPEVDRDRDGDLSAAELELARDALAANVVAAVGVTTREGPCPGTLGPVELAEQDGVAIRARFECPARPSSVVLHAAFLAKLARGHRHLATATAPGAMAHGVLLDGADDLTLELPAEGAPADRSTAGVFGSLFLLGVEHILTGYDHLLFLFGLILVASRLRSMLVVVTAFTVAHSITLGLAALDVVTPSPRLVEPAIALSIAYVGVENWFVADASRRWMITFPFGLVHGFGFASALREISLPRSEVPAALFAFNLGVELGQLAVLVVMLPVVLHVRRQAWFGRAGVRVVSAGVAALGLYWFMARVA